MNERLSTARQNLWQAMQEVRDTSQTAGGNGDEAYQTALERYGGALDQYNQVWQEPPLVSNDPVAYGV